MLNIHFSPWPLFSDEEVEAAGRVLRSNKVNYWTGTECREFEREFASWVGTRYAISLANGTIALEASLRALGVGPGDEVVVTPRSFMASAASVVLEGGTPVFADVEPNSGNISAETIKRVLTSRTKAIMCVHLAGWPCDMDPIMALAERYGLKVIEDCAQAHGARYKGRSVGSIGHVGAWSFCQDKIMTTGGEGGMVTTNDDALWAAMWSYKDHGKNFQAMHERTHQSGFRWVHEGFGTNGRMTEMQAAIGRIQLRRMPEWTATRSAHSAALSRALLPFAGERGCIRLPTFSCNSHCPTNPELCAARCTHARYKFYAYVRQENLAIGWTRDRIVEELNRAGVPCYQGSCSEIYLEKAFEGTDWRPAARLPTARQLGETSLMFLVHPSLTASEIETMSTVITEVLSNASL